MTYIVNGQEMTFEEAVSISDIMKNLGIEDQVMATAVNMEVVKKDKWDTYKAKDGDKIEMLHFVGGG